jgi:hypothetical protein
MRAGPPTANTTMLDGSVRRIRHPLFEIEMDRWENHEFLFQ